MLLSWPFQLYWSQHVMHSPRPPKRNSCTDSFLNFVWHGNSHSRFHGEKYWCVIGTFDWFFNGANARATWHFRESEYTNIKTLLGHYIFWIHVWKLVRVLAFTWAKHCRGDFSNTLSRCLMLESIGENIDKASVAGPPLTACAKRLCPPRRSHPF